MTDARLSAEDLLALLRMEDEKLLRTIDDLSPEQWQAETTCPGWTVHQVVAHLARGVESYVTAILNGQHGDYTRLSDAERVARNQFFAGHSARELAVLLADSMERFQEVFGSLDEQRLQARGAHPYGLMTGYWYVNQRLAEVAFHSWDVRSSLGLDRSFDGGVAEALLPLIVLDNLRFTLRGNDPFVLRVRSWTVSLPDGALTQATPDLTLDGPAARLCLLLYGRERSLEGVQVEGDRRVLAAISGP